MKYIMVAIENTVSNTDMLYTYKTEENLISIGDAVTVPFGNGNRTTKGYVFDVFDRPDFDAEKVKPIKFREESVLSEEAVKLCIFMKERYLCKYWDAINCFIPPGVVSYDDILSIKDEKAAREFIEKNGRNKRQEALVSLLLDRGSIKKRDLKNIFEFDYSVIRALVKKEILIEGTEEKKRVPNQQILSDGENRVDLTDEQKKALIPIFNATEERKVKQFLIHGVTGSGKTELYMQAIEKVIKLDKTAIMLVPEISLTVQTIERFKGRFGEENIAILHSRLSSGERYDEWSRIKRGQAKIVIGARSAIFAPLSKIGVIVIDEEHESTYKADNSPKYDTIELAGERADFNEAVLILGSATPSLKSYYNSETEILNRLELTGRYNDTGLPEIEIVDMRTELQKGNRSIFSVKLYDSIKAHLSNKNQIILFLNRRGYSPFVSCRGCGYVMKCPECGVSMTYHKENNNVECHFCGYKTPMPQICPSCGSKYIKHFGVGTEKVEEAVRQLFPDSTSARLDMDTIRKKGSAEKILNDFKRGDTDILIGTQLVAKGLDFKNVGLVGIVAADLSLNIPDYRSGERTFQLISQAAGRAGRGSEQGEVIIQTYTPDNYAIKAAAKHDYRSFYEEEIFIRKQMQYPPFGDLIQLVFSAVEEEKAAECSQKFCDLFFAESGEEGKISLLGPRAAHLNKIRGRYRYYVLIKCNKECRQSYLKLISEIKAKLAAGKFKDCMTAVDINPYSLV